MEARIYELGNGLPDAGDHVVVENSWGEQIVLRVADYIGPIHAGGHGEGNWSLAEVEVSDLDPEEVEVFPAGVSIPCQCGLVTGVECGADLDGLGVEVIPQDVRASHEAAGNRGIYPFNGAIRVRVTPECARELLESEGEWARRVEA